VTDLTCRYLGLELSGPLVASAGPHTGRLASLAHLQDAGVSAVVLPSLFEEEIVQEELSLHEALEAGTGSFAESLDYFPATDFCDLGAQRHVRLVEEAKARLSIPVIASLNATGVGSWQSYAAMMADAGADAIELNLYALATDPARGAHEVEQAYLDAVRAVRSAVNLPLAVKLSPYFSSLPQLAAAVVAAGADGLVLFNRFYQPDLNLRSLQVEPTLDLSTSTELRLPLRWLAILSPQLVGTSLAATGGIHTAKDVLKALLVGADITCMTSALLRNGPGHARTVLDGVTAWLAENEYASIEQLRGSLSCAGVKDPAAFERANYVKVLSSYSPIPDE
jgi:dihydroorotate dehydrogenase (fumarate)